MKMTLAIIIFIILLLGFFYWLGQGESTQPVSGPQFLINGTPTEISESVVPQTKQIDLTEQKFVIALTVIDGEKNSTFLNFGNQADGSIISEIDLGENVVIDSITSLQHAFTVNYSVGQTTTTTTFNLKQ